MSQDAARQDRAAVPERPSGTAAPTPRRLPGGDPGERMPPLSPLFTARTDLARGAVRTRGHLDRVGAECLCRTVRALQRLGHRDIAVQGPATVDEQAREVLAELRAQLSGEDVRLTVG